MLKLQRMYNIYMRFHSPGNCYQWIDKDPALWLELPLAGSPWHFESQAYDGHEPAGSDTGHVNGIVALLGGNSSDWGRLFDGTVNPYWLVPLPECTAKIRKQNFCIMYIKMWLNKWLTEAVISHTKLIQTMKNI